MKKLVFPLLLGCGLGFFSVTARAQTAAYATDTVLPDATLQACVQYALKHYPLVQQALLDERITDRQIKSRLADWYPQVNFDYSYQYYFQLPPVYFNGSFIASGTKNNSTLGLGATQNIFN